TACSECVCPLR
nr:cysteine proteinase inhibitor short chain [pineapple, stem, Peptide, 11 aa] [Ananas comosus]1BI6_L Chain L, BROMELAIN INHIBITOR VI [Ananas comosus]2BI6_L Chain L, BROMELAIN INHIBITOR VI [Ananas comosus]